MTRAWRNIFWGRWVVLTKTGGGAPELTMARTAQRCEQFGIKTAIAMLHMGGTSTTQNMEDDIFSMPEVDAIVSMGGPFMELRLLPWIESSAGPAHPPKGRQLKVRL